MAYKRIGEKEKEKMLNVDQLVFRFQDGDDEAGEELIRMFGGHPKEEVNFYIGKYFWMLRGDSERFKWKDKDSRKFICCFLEDSEMRKSMKRFYQNGDVRTYAMKKLHKIVDQCKPIEDEDLKQELRLMFIEQAKRYKNISKNINFPGYLFNSYRYRIATMITRRMRKYDPYLHMYSSKQILSLQEDRYVDGGTEIEIEENTFNQLMLQDDDELGNSWVRGLTCGPQFRDLTSLQRLIIKLYYDEKMTDRAIASKLSMHINTIHNNRKRAKAIIEGTVERLYKEGYEE